MIKTAFLTGVGVAALWFPGFYQLIATCNWASSRDTLKWMDAPTWMLECECFNVNFPMWNSHCEHWKPESHRAHFTDDLRSSHKPFISLIYSCLKVSTASCLAQGSRDPRGERDCERLWLAWRINTKSLVKKPRHLKLMATFARCEAAQNMKLSKNFAVQFFWFSKW